MEEHHIKVERTARYYTTGASAMEASDAWVACHGYAQLAADFANDLNGLVDDKTLLVVPEGLSRFYTKGFYGRVGATWMTSEDRLNEIEDYVNYLDKLVFNYFTQIPHTTQRHVLGFSQGCATVCRWLTYRRPHFDHIWLCSGSLPHDMDWSAFTSYLKGKSLHIVIGKEDEWITLDAVNDTKKLLEDHHIDFDLNIFDGGHVVDIDTIKEILKRERS